MNRLVIFLLCFSCLSFKSFSQGTDIRYGKNKVFVSFNLIPLQTTIDNIEAYDASQLTLKKRFTVNGSLEMGYNLAPWVGISTGISYFTYSSTLSLDNYHNSYNSVDSENDAFEMQIEGKNIEETQKIAFLALPIQIQFQYYITKKAGLYFNTGVRLLFPVSKEYTGKGTFSYNGYYPQYNITLTGLPEYGYPSNVATNRKDKLKVNSININMMLSGGFTFRISPLASLSCGFYYEKSTGNISGYKPTNYYLNKYQNEYNPIMSSSSKVQIQALGALVSLKYFIK